MYIQIFTEHAVRILQYLHIYRGLQSGMDIAESLGISYPTFIVIAGHLRRAGLLISVQGRNGGFRLGRPATEISFYDVFLCIEKDLCISRSLEGGGGADGEVQAFLQTWQDSLITEMSNQTIAELAS